MPESVNNRPYLAPAHYPAPSDAAPALASNNRSEALRPSTDRHSRFSSDDVRNFEPARLSELTKRSNGTSWKHGSAKSRSSISRLGNCLRGVLFPHYHVLNYLSNSFDQRANKIAHRIHSLTSTNADNVRFGWYQTVPGPGSSNKSEWKYGPYRAVERQASHTGESSRPSAESGDLAEILSRQMETLRQITNRLNALYPPPGEHKNTSK